MHDVHDSGFGRIMHIMQTMHFMQVMQIMQGYKTMYFMQQAEVESSGFAYLALLFSGGANIPAADVSH